MRPRPFNGEPFAEGTLFSVVFTGIIGGIAMIGHAPAVFFRAVSFAMVCYLAWVALDWMDRRRGRGPPLADLA